MVFCSFITLWWLDKNEDYISLNLIKDYIIGNEAPRKFDFISLL